MALVQWVAFEALVGETFSKVEVSHDKQDVWFTTLEGVVYHMYPCCESVYLEDVCGDLNDLINSEVIGAEEYTNTVCSEDYDSFTWTFYKLRTRKGYVDLRWFGSSNGYYSESVKLDRIEPED